MSRAARAAKAWQARQPRRAAGRPPDHAWAHGISDTLALGLLNEALGLGLPIIAAPWPGAGLLAHPAFGRSIADLSEWGVRIILDPDRPAQPGGSAAFPRDKLRAALTDLHRAS